MFGCRLLREHISSHVCKYLKLDQVVYDYFATVFTDPPQILTDPPQIRTDPSKILTDPPQIRTDPPQIQTDPPQFHCSSLILPNSN